MKTTPLVCLAAAALAACGSSGAATELQNLGSDTMLEVAGAWAEAYHAVRPEVVVSVSGGGSSFCQKHWRRWRHPSAVSMVGSSCSRVIIGSMVPRNGA